MSQSTEAGYRPSLGEAYPSVVSLPVHPDMSGRDRCCDEGSVQDRPLVCSRSVAR